MPAATDDGAAGFVTNSVSIPTTPCGSVLASVDQFAQGHRNAPGAAYDGNWNILRSVGKATTVTDLMARPVSLPAPDTPNFRRRATERNTNGVGGGNYHLRTDRRTNSVRSN